MDPDGEWADGEGKKSVEECYGELLERFGKEFGGDLVEAMREGVNGGEGWMLEDPTVGWRGQVDEMGRSGILM